MDVVPCFLFTFSSSSSAARRLLGYDVIKRFGGAVQFGPRVSFPADMSKASDGYGGQRLVED
jgi:hypothetical protein